jgi:hypothetical protein
MNDESQITVKAPNTKPAGGLRWQPMPGSALIVGPMSSGGGTP